MIRFFLLLLCLVSFSSLACERVKYSPKKRNGNVVNVKATLSEENINCGSRISSKVRKKIIEFGSDGDQAGHIIAKSLGGYGSVISNVVPMKESVNKGEYKSAENKVLKCIKKKGGNAYLNITIRYQDRSMPKRPTKFIYKAKFDNCPSFSKTINN